MLIISNIFKYLGSIIVNYVCNFMPCNQSKEYKDSFKKNPEFYSTFLFYFVKIIYMLIAILIMTINYFDINIMYFLYRFLINLCDSYDMLDICNNLTLDVCNNWGLNIYNNWGLNICNNWELDLCNSWVLDMCNNLILDMCNNLTLDMCKDLNPLGSNQVGFPNTGNNIGFGGPSGSGGPNLLPILDLNKTPELSLEPESQMSDDIRVNLTDGDLQNIKDTSNNLRHSYNHRHIVMQQKLFLRTSTMLYEFQKNPAYYDKTEVQFIHDGLTNVRSLFPKLPVIIDENEYRLELYHDSNKIYKLYFISNDPDCFSHAKSISMTNQVRYFGTENKLSLMNDILDNQNKHHIDNGSGEVSTSKYLTGEFKNSFNKFGRPVLIMDIKNILNPR